MAENRLYYGIDLDILQRYVKDETVDLVYLDPPLQGQPGPQRALCRTGWLTLSGADQGL